MFLRAQLSSQVATITDFLFTILLVKLFDLYYVYATLSGAVCGGIVNCFINYRWTFKFHGKKRYVIFKFIIVWVCSIWLNTWGTYMFTEMLGRISWVRDTLSLHFDDYFLVPKVIVAILVAFCWNYMMQRYFVYRDVKIKGLLRKQNRTK